MIPKLSLWSLQACAVSYSYKKLYLLQVLTVRGMCVHTLQHTHSQYVPDFLRNSPVYILMHIYDCMFVFI